jgi:tetratricopeptide (TPR) repeat protein
MREAMEASRPADNADDGSPAAAYHHFLKGRLAHYRGDDRASLDALRLALATDEGNPYLTAALAEQHARLGELAMAERLLKSLLAVKPSYYRAHLLMGRVSMEMRKLAKAKFHLKRAQSLRPSEPEPALLLAQLALDAGAVDEAVRTVEAQAKAAPQDGFALKRLAQVLLDRGELDRARRLLERAVERDPGDVEALLLSAQVAEGTGKVEIALGFYERALTRDADQRESLLGAGRLALQRADFPLARAYFDRLLRLADDPELAMRVAFLFLGADREEEAGAVLEAAREEAPQNPRLAFYRGLLNERRGNFVRAAAAYAEVPKGAELYPTARMRRAMALLQAGQAGEALVPLKEAVVDRPEDWDAYPVYARALELTGDAAGGETLLRHALARHPVASLYEGLSELLVRRGRMGEAVEMLRAALKQAPKDEQLLFALGVALERQGRLDEAVQRMREVLAVNPDHAAALNFIGYSLAERGSGFDEAERLIQRALQLRPETGAYLDSLGWVYYCRGQYEKAVGTLEHAATLSPYEPVIIEHLGDAYRKLAKLPEAAATYRRALQSLEHAPLLDDADVRRRSLEQKLKLLSTEAASR